MPGIARVVVAVHAVPDLEEALAHHGGEVLGGDSPFVVGMVHVNEGRSAGALTGFSDPVQRLLDDLRHGGAFQRRQGLMQVDGADVDLAFVFGGLGDLFGLDEQESSPLLHQRAEFIVRLEPDLLDAVGRVRPGLHPIRTVPAQVGTEGVPGANTRPPGLPLGPVGHRLQGNPALTPTQEIMIRQGQEVVSAFAVRLGDHFREVVAVRPERVRVQVAFPPAQWFRGRRKAE